MRMNISVPDVLAEEVRKRDLPVSAICQRALNDEVTRLRAMEASGMEEITVMVGSPPVAIRFTGRWLVRPDPERTTAAFQEGYDATAYFGVALTSHGRIAVYMGYSDNRWPGRLNDYDGLDHATGPAGILALAAAELGQERVTRLGI
jgi:hypothetical protein